MKISDESIEEIKKAANIVDVVSEYTPLSKPGVHRTAFCPFERCKQVVPMFVVNTERNVYKCFACGASGDPIKFTMDISGIGYDAALRKLAGRYRVKIVEVNHPTH